MITVRPSQERGVANLGWLDSRHTFSFGNYYDPNHLGFATLRVINEDKVQGDAGFGTHGHRDMEIISYILQGALEHKDNIGNGSIIRPGDVQRMSAGTGVLHSEYNPSKTDPAHFLQIWILPEKKGLAPSYEQKTFSEAEKRGKLRLIGSRDGREGSVTIHQDVDLYVAVLQTVEQVTYPIQNGRSIWVQVIRGNVLINDQLLSQGDGAALSEESFVTLTGGEIESEILLFDMA